MIIINVHPNARCHYLNQVEVKGKQDYNSIYGTGYQGVFFKKGIEQRQPCSVLRDRAHTEKRSIPRTGQLQFWTALSVVSDIINSFCQQRDKGWIRTIMCM